MCSKCKNVKCTCCKKGPRGPIGPRGPAGVEASSTPVNVVGEGGVEVSESIVSGVQTFTVTNPKQFFYLDATNSLDISLDPNFVPLQYFSPTGYAGLTFTNTSSQPKTYKIFASYEHAMAQVSVNGVQYSSWVDAALIKEPNSILYESNGIAAVSGYLYYGPNGSDIIGTGTPIHNLLDDQGSPVEFRFLQSRIPLRGSFFYGLTLGPSETVTLKFRTKDPSEPSTENLARLLKAQIMVEEV